MFIKIGFFMKKSLVLTASLMFSIACFSPADALSEKDKDFWSKSAGISFGVSVAAGIVSIPFGIYLLKDLAQIIKIKKEISALRNSGNSSLISAKISELEEKIKELKKKMLLPGISFAASLGVALGSFGCGLFSVSKVNEFLKIERKGMAKREDVVLEKAGEIVDDFWPIKKVFTYRKRLQEDLKVVDKVNEKNKEKLKVLKKESESKNSDEIKGRIEDLEAIVEFYDKHSEKTREELKKLEYIEKLPDDLEEKIELYDDIFRARKITGIDPFYAKITGLDPYEPLKSLERKVEKWEKWGW